MPDVNLALYRYLDTNGDGTGTKNANGDYSGAATDFKLVPAADDRFEIARLIVSIVDAGSLDSGKYGNNVVLSNGITIAVKDSGGVVEDITDGVPITTNAHWGRLAGVDVSPMGWGSGNEQLTVRFTFEKSGVPLILDGGHGQYLALTLNDDFTGLVEHHFMAQGRHSWYESS